MKKIAFLFLLLTPLFLLAQGNNQKPAGETNSKPSAALLFSFNGLDNVQLNNYNGGIGIKFFPSKTLGLRFGMQLGMRNKTLPANPTESENGKDGSEYSSNYGTSIGVELRIKNGKVCPYLGGGFGYTSYSYEKTDAVKWNKSNSGVIARNKITDSGIFNLAIFFFGGAEFFLSEHFSLSAEYRLGYDYYSAGERETKMVVVQGDKNLASPATKIDLYSTSQFQLASVGTVTVAIYF